MFVTVKIGTERPDRGVGDTPALGCRLDEAHARLIAGFRRPRSARSSDVIWIASDETRTVAIPGASANL